MSSDFWAGYLSGALGIIIGNPLDVIKVRLQAGNPTDASARPHLSRFEKAGSLVRGELNRTMRVPFENLELMGY